MKKQLFTLFALLLCAVATPFSASAQDLSVLTDIFSSPAGNATMTVVLILAGAALYFLALYQMKKWRMPSTVASAAIWFKDNWPNLVFFAFIIWLIYAKAKPDSFSVGGALMFGASANLIIDFFQKWITSAKTNN